jgi:protein-disulfide isomerase
VRSDGRFSRPQLLLVVAAVAAVAAAALIGASRLQDTGAGPSATTPLAGGAENASLFAGIPQHGNVLGSPQAPVTLIEYADLQCPFCASFAADVLPELITDYVRPGKVKLEFRGLKFVGPDSEKALRTVIAAGRDGKLWTLSHLIYINQGMENSGWVSDGFLRKAAHAVPRLDGELLLQRAGDEQVTRQLEQFERQAARDGVSSTPSFRVGRSGGALRPLAPETLDSAEFRLELDELLAG